MSLVHSPMSSGGLTGGPFRGELRPPADKSITHRAVLLAAIAEGITTISADLPGRDNLATIRIMQQLGVVIEVQFPNHALALAQEEGIVGVEAWEGERCRIRVVGRGFDGLKGSASELDCGNSGTSARLLCGVLAGRPFPSTLTGDASLKRRPFKRVVGPLSQMGASFSGEHLPLSIRGGGLKGIDFRSPVASAQVKSALLLAGVQAMGETTVHEPRRSRDHTERMLRAMGVPLVEELEEDGGWRVAVSGGQLLRSLGEFEIPGDFSSAAFFLVAATVLPGSQVTLRDTLFNPTRTGLADVLERMGAKITSSNRKKCGGEDVIDLVVTAAPLVATEVTPDDVVLAIDEIPILAVAAALAKGSTRIRGAEELRVKESDRIAMIATMLRSFSIPVEEFADGLEITGRPELVGSGGAFNAAMHRGWRSSGDHRIAMSGMILSYVIYGTLPITDRAAVETSFPNFFEIFLRLTT